jgi:hypothetical protein
VNKFWWIRISYHLLNITSSTRSLQDADSFRGSKHSCITDRATLSLVKHSAHNSLLLLSRWQLSESIHLTTVHVRPSAPTGNGSPSRLWRPAYSWKIDTNFSCMKLYSIKSQVQALIRITYTEVLTINIILFQ